jgi:hypothetical protein
LAVSAFAQSIQLDGGEFKVSPAEPNAKFSVYAASAELPMLGSLRLENHTLTFKPRFPLSEGVKYRAVYQLAGRTPVEATFEVARHASQARVDHIYPSADVLPANILKLYIVFSAPMSRGEAWKHIRLLDHTGNAVKNAFLEIDQELWDPEARRLTVLFDPGRVKRDLAPNLQIGAPVMEGRRYTVQIDRDFPDAHGAPLAEAAAKAFRGGPADRTPVDPAQWRITAPRAGTRSALLVTFPKSMDFALAQRTIFVEAVAGKISLDRNETQWSFVPDQPWTRGAHRVAIDNTLEDICGNRIGRLFDRNDGDRERAPTGKVYRAFEIN